LSNPLRPERLTTPEARAAGLEGSVILYIEWNADGNLETAHVIQGLGLGLDEKAVEAARHWHSNPGTGDGRRERRR
jgi:protein TonB